jgi:8-oxo-dGTP pyrophosphatase MutT (NUDIX family)
MTQLIHDIVARIKPYDVTEAAHQKDVLNWITSGAQIFRIAKPDNPPKHLVSYFVLYDESAGKLMLIDHVTSGLLLPAGGHIEQDEDPKITVIREADEELKIEADFNTLFGDAPLFVTVTTTVGQGQHVDVSLWYIIAGNSNQKLQCDPREMSGYQWLTPDEVLAIDIKKLDPNVHRFVEKMKGNR